MQKLWTLSRAIARSDQLFFQFLPWRARVVYSLKRAELLRRPVSAAGRVDGQGQRAGEAMRFDGNLKRCKCYCAVLLLLGETIQQHGTWVVWTMKKRESPEK